MPSSELPPGGQLRADALARHGVSSSAVGAVVRAAEALRRLTREHGVELAATLDADSGDMPAPIMRGTRRAVDVGAHLRAFAPGREYVMLHSHPESESFSWQDAALLVTRPSVRALVVVARDGAWYLLSRAPGTPVASVEDVVVAVATERDRLSPPGDPARRRGAPGRSARQREISHQAWTNLAHDLGLRYDRLR